MAGTLFAIVERYRSRGLATPFAVRSVGHVLCGGCRREDPASLVRLLALDRPPHDVAPGERLAVAALQCNACSRQGTLPLTYGPCAAPEEDGVYTMLASLAVASGPALHGVLPDVADVTSAQVPSGFDLSIA